MERRHFIKLSATVAATVLFNRLTYAAGTGSIINHPDGVWAQADGNWFQLKPSGGNNYTYKDVEVSLKINGNTNGVYIQSPSSVLTGVRLMWKNGTASSAEMLGDNYERTYGDMAWKKPESGIKNPWYV